MVNPSLHNLADMLKQYQLAITNPRKKILKAFLTHHTALTQEDVRNYCGNSVDKVTIYRTLSLFVQLKIIHLLPSTEYINRYTLLLSYDHSSGKYFHFTCNACRQTYCLQYLPMPELLLPAGYLVQETEVIIKGICKHCSTS